MEIQDLKSAWNRYSSQEMNKHRLEKETIDDLLKGRTYTLVDRIDRNIRIGIVILIGFIGYVLIGDSYLSDMLMKEPIKYPTWLNFIDVFTSILIVTTFLFFVLRYFRIRRNFSPDTQLKVFLFKILETIKIYQRMFYMTVVILLINIIISFIAGGYLELKLKANKASGGIINLSSAKIMMIIGISLAVLIPLISLFFFLLHRGFNNLYGRYMHKIKETLLELDESESTD